LTFRILFLFLISTALGVLALLNTGIAQLLWALCFLGALILTVTIIRTFKRIRLQHEMLIITDSFGIEQTFDLKQTLSWSERRVYLQGRQQRSLILLLKSERIVLSNYDSITEFEKTYQYLDTNFPDRRV
jgi:hypothetical protein